MRSTAIVLSILALALVLPVAPLAAADTPATTSAPAELGQGPSLSIEAPLFGAVDQAESCASEEYFLVIVPNTRCEPGVCDQPCEDGGGTAVGSFWDRIDCNCVCCAD